MLDTKLKVYSLNNLPIHLETEYYDGKAGDTKVILPSSGTLCWVSGEEREKFIEELNSIVDKYRI